MSDYVQMDTNAFQTAVENGVLKLERVQVKLIVARLVTESFYFLNEHMQVFHAHITIEIRFEYV